MVSVSYEIVRVSYELAPASYEIMVKSHITGQEHSYRAQPSAIAGFGLPTSLFEYTRAGTMWLLLIAIFGLLVPNGIFIHWLFTDFRGFNDVIDNRLALGFIIEAFVVMAYWFAKNPPGKVRWYWFIVFSLIGGIGFGIPFYWWLNKRRV
jgi:hypothetical protein